MLEFCGRCFFRQYVKAKLESTASRIWQFVYKKPLFAKCFGPRCERMRSFPNELTVSKIFLLLKLFHVINFIKKLILVFLVKAQ